MKPENILLAASGHVRLSDFDLSQVAGSSKPVQMSIPFNAEALVKNKPKKKKSSSKATRDVSNSAVGSAAIATAHSAGRAGDSQPEPEFADAETTFDERDPSRLHQDPEPQGVFRVPVVDQEPAPIEESPSLHRGLAHEPVRRFVVTPATYTRRVLSLMKNRT